MDDKFTFKINSIDCGWAHAEVSLGGGSLEFYISSVLGDNLREILLSVLPFYSDNMAVSDLINDGWYDDFPIDRISIDEEGTLVNWDFIYGDDNKDVSVTITAQRYNEQGEETPIKLSATVPAEKYALAVVGEIDEWLRTHGIMQYLRGWSGNFPLEEFIVAKACVLKVPLPANLNEEIKLLLAPVGRH